MKSVKSVKGMFCVFLHSLSSFYQGNRFFSVHVNGGSTAVSYNALSKDKTRTQSQALVKHMLLHNQPQTQSWLISSCSTNPAPPSIHRRHNLLIDLDRRVDLSHEPPTSEIANGAFEMY